MDPPAPTSTHMDPPWSRVEHCGAPGALQSTPDRSRPMECYRMLWNVVECCGMLWNVVECHGMLWNVMECHGIGQNIVEHCGTL
jgi:hypothetical protein